MEVNTRQYIVETPTIVWAIILDCEFDKLNICCYNKSWIMLQIEQCGFIEQNHWIQKN